MTALVLGTGLMISCEGNESTQATLSETDEAQAQDIAYTDAVAEEAFDFSDMGTTVAIDGRMARPPRLPECATVTHNRDAKTIVIDFGTACQVGAGTNARTFAGKIKVVYTGIKPEEGMGRTVTFDGFSINGNVVSGTIVATKYANRSTGILDMTRTFDCKIAFAVDQSEFSFTGTRTHTWKVLDGKLEVTGTIAGTSRQGQTFSVSILEPIVRTKSCFDGGNPFPVSGIVERVIASKPAIRINFGSGTCDDLATISMGDRSKEITLKRNR